MKQTVEDDKVKDKITDEERKQIAEACDEASSGWTVTRRPRRTSSPTRRRSSRRCAHQSSPRCTRAPVAVCPVACPTWAAPQLVVTRPVVLPLAGQLLRRSINVY